MPFLDLWTMIGAAVLTFAIYMWSSSLGVPLQEAGEFLLAFIVSMGLTIGVRWGWSVLPTARRASSKPAKSPKKRRKD